MTFVTAGYPTQGATVPILLAMQAGGADIIELGVPFSDPIADETLRLLQTTAEQNRAAFTEIFRPVPTNLVRDWNAYTVCCISSKL